MTGHGRHATSFKVFILIMIVFLGIFILSQSGSEVIRSVQKYRHSSTERLATDASRNETKSLNSLPRLSQSTLFNYSYTSTLRKFIAALKERHIGFGADNIDKSNQNQVVEGSNTNVNDSTVQSSIQRYISERDRILKETLNSSEELGRMASLIQENMFRTGIGLEPYSTEKGQQTWKENGVVFKLFEGPYDPKNTIPSPYRGEYEAYIPYKHTQFFLGRDHPPVPDEHRKLIAWWARTKFTPEMNQPRPLRGCPDFPCYITTNTTNITHADAFLINGDLVKGRPPPRRPDQIFILNSHEPPVSNWLDKADINKEHLGWKGVFNWTMNYRMDSDIVHHYGILRRRPNLDEKRNFTYYQNMVKNKTGLVAWIVSNCGSPGNRHKYVDLLRKYLSVDNYGKCGRLQCPRNDDDSCLQMIGEKYKFYLSFENSITTDYITEKFFRWFSANVIIIGRASDDYQIHAPADIFLNTARFSSPHALAEKILYLDKNVDEYAKMLQEKDKYMTLYEDYPIRNVKQGTILYMTYHYQVAPLCEICHRLWNLDKYSKTIPDIIEWLDREPIRQPVDLVAEKPPK